MPIALHASRENAARRARVRGGVRPVALGLALCLSTVATAGVAQVPVQGAASQSSSAARVVVIEYDAAESSALLAEGITRLAAELRVAGFEVQLAGERPMDDAPPSEPSTPPPAHESYATIKVSEQDQQLSFEIRAETRPTPSRLIILGREHDVPVLALKSTEFLRAGLAPHVSAPRPAPVAPSTIEARPARASLAPDHPWQLDLGAALLTNLGTGDRLPLLTVHPAYLVLPRLALGVALAVPLDDARFNGNTGTASYRVWLGSITANASWLKWPNGEMTVGARAGLARTDATSVPNPPLEARQSAPWSLTFGLDAGIDYRLIEPLALVAEAQLLALSPTAVVAAGEDERRLGRPSLVLGLSARVFYE